MGDTKDYRLSRWAQNISGADGTLIRQCVAVNTCMTTVQSFQGSLTRAPVLITLCVFSFGFENLVLVYLCVSVLGYSQ